MIGGNIAAELQIKEKIGTDAMGSAILGWVTKGNLLGWLDLQNGDSERIKYNAKIQESTHVFVCDYVDLSDCKTNATRVVIGATGYDVKLIDDPMGMHEQLEIYLKYTGD